MPPIQWDERYHPNTFALVITGTISGGGLHYACQQFVSTRAIHDYPDATERAREHIRRELEEAWNRYVFPQYDHHQPASATTSRAEWSNSWGDAGFTKEPAVATPSHTPEELAAWDEYDQEED